MSRDDATRLYQIIPNISKAVKVAENIIPLDQKFRKQYLHALAKSPKSSHLKLLKKAKASMLQQKVTVDLNKSNARKLQNLATKDGIDITEAAEKIMSGYLKKR